LDSIHPQARKAAEASLCAAGQGAEAFWAMHERLFETAQEWSGQENLTEQFTSYAAELGLDTDAFVACLESGETATQVQTELEQGEAAGVSGVPAFFINDWFLSGAQPFEVFQETIEAAMQGEHPPPTPTPLPPGATIFDSNPERPGYTYGGDATRGSAEAEIVLVEFVDFQSVENRKHFLETWPDLEKEYVESGKVRLVVKHFPAADQPTGFKAAEAAECAGQQEAFWAMHDLLFQKQEEWSQADDATATFEEYAGELDLDADAFAACLEEGQTRDKVEQDFAITQENQFPSAPQFFIIMGQRAGNVPVDQLQEVIEQLLEQGEGG
jgi:protein-disulfide isomerase